MSKENTVDQVLPTTFNLFSSSSTTLAEYTSIPLHVRYNILVNSTRDLRIRIDQKEIPNCDDSIWLRFEWPHSSRHLYSFTVGKAIGIIFQSHCIRGIIKNCTISNGNHRLVGPYQEVLAKNITYQKGRIEFNGQHSYGHHVSIRIRMTDKPSICLATIEKIKDLREKEELKHEVNQLTQNFDSTSEESDDSTMTD
jgi:hypothetical protein